jgi:hypothetical protein
MYTAGRMVVESGGLEPRIYRNGPGEDLHVLIVGEPHGGHTKIVMDREALELLHRRVGEHLAGLDAEPDPAGEPPLETDRRHAG